MNSHLTRTDLIWNRACEGAGSATRQGDKALASLLVFHSAAMNGGVFHAIELITAAELSAAMDGYKLFGLESVLDIVTDAKRILNSGNENEIDSKEPQIDKEFFATDSILLQRFEKYYAENPMDFEPPESFAEE